MHGADGSRAKRGVCGVMKGPTETLVVAGDTCVLTFRDGGGGAYQATIEGYAAPGLTVHVSQMHLPQPHTISQASRGVYGGSELLLAQVSFVYFLTTRGLHFGQWSSPLVLNIHHDTHSFIHSCNHHTCQERKRAHTRTHTPMRACTRAGFL